MEAEKKVLELEEALREYHGKAAALQLIPRTAKRANGMQYEIVLNAGAAAAGNMLTVDMKVRIAAAADDEDDARPHVTPTGALR